MLLMLLPQAVSNNNEELKALRTQVINRLNVLFQAYHDVESAEGKKRIEIFLGYADEPQHDYNGTESSPQNPCPEGAATPGFT